MVVSQLTNAYQQDVVRLEETLNRNKEDYLTHKDVLQSTVESLEEENLDMKYQIEQLTEVNAELSLENKRFKESADIEEAIKIQFAEKLGSFQLKQNEYESQIRLLKDDIKRLTDENKSVKDSADAQVSNVEFLSAEKIRLERRVANYQINANTLKEECLSKSSVINQRDNQLRSLHKQLKQTNDQLEVVKKDLEERNIRMSVIQSKIINKKSQQDDTQIQMDKLKRANFICEDRIKSLHQKVAEISEKYESVCVDYEKLKSEHEVVQQDVEKFKSENQECMGKVKHTEAKYDGIDLKYRNLIEQYDVHKADYEKTIQILDEVNKARNKLFDEINVKNKKIEQMTKNEEDLNHWLYQSKALVKKLQDRLKDVEIEFEQLSRKDTSNSQMSSIQISSLESKYLAMFKKFKNEQKLKAKWVQSYQNEYTQNLQKDIELKKAEVNRQAYAEKHKELTSFNKDLNVRVHVAETKLDTLNEERRDLMAKIERKNLELDSCRGALKSFDEHKDMYIKRLRTLTDEKIHEAKTIESIKQMEVEDLTMKIVNLEHKLDKLELDHRNEYRIIKEKDQIIKDRDTLIKIEQEKLSKEKSLVIGLKVDIDMLKEDLKEKVSFCIVM